jgi:hypothetical protein
MVQHWYGHEGELLVWNSDKAMLFSFMTFQTWPGLFFISKSQGNERGRKRSS